MKKIISILLCAVLLLQLCGCASKKDKTPTEEKADKETESVTGATVFKALKNQVDFDSELTSVEDPETLFQDLPDGSEVTLLKGPDTYSDQLGLVEVEEEEDLPQANESVNAYLQGMYDSASLMLSHGHKRILYLDGTAGAAGPIYRLRGYRHALQDGGVTPDEGLILRGEFSIQFGYDMVLSLLDEGKEFTAIVSGSDLVAIGAIKALRSRGIRVPEDIEVMGFDNIELSEIFEPKLSTVSKPHYEIASQAAKMLISTIENEELPIRRMTVASTLILRDTTR